MRTWKSDMRVGHINLARPGDGRIPEFISLVEALHCEGIEQHLVVRDRWIIKHLMPLQGIKFGPVAHSAVTASCLIPKVDIAHIHDPAAGQAGLLLTLTRSIPYVLTHSGSLPKGRTPLAHAVYRRAACIICPEHADLDVLRHFEPGLQLAVILTTDQPIAASDYVKVYQNSQRMPIAGNNGIQ